MVLIYVLKVYRKIFSSILLRKEIFNSLLACFFWKACTFSNFERFPCWKSKNYSQHFSVEICCEIYLFQIIKYWVSNFTLYLTWGVFSLVCALSVFIYLFLIFFFFYRYFPWQTLMIHRIAGEGEGIIIFLVFNLLPLTNIHLVHWDF